MLTQNLGQKLLQNLSPQQIQLLKLIQLPTLAFEQRIQKELDENPALEISNLDDAALNSEIKSFDNNSNENQRSEEVGINDYLDKIDHSSYKGKISHGDMDHDKSKKEFAFTSEQTLTQFLQDQLKTSHLTREDELILDFLIGSIDANGYLRREDLDILDDLAFTQNIHTTTEKIQKLVGIIQQLDPPGIAARNLQDCLLIQLNRKEKSKINGIAKSLVGDHFELLAKKHYEKIILKLQIDEHELKSAISLIEKLNPKPGSVFEHKTVTVEQIIPDFTISIIDEKLELNLNSKNYPELNVSKRYGNILETYSNSKESKNSQQKEAAQFIKQKLDGAKWFVEAIKQRQKTLLLCMKAIMNYQKEYFLTGDERKLKPMILKDIAEVIDMDISTISRVANSKYVTTPYGTKLIKELFSEGIKNDQGQEVSNIKIKDILLHEIQKENKKKPLTDEKLTLTLNQKGFPMARRTIAKYREQLGIPVARLRKEI